MGQKLILSMLLFFSILSLGCGMDIVQQSESKISDGGSNGGERDIPPVEDVPVVNLKYLGTCYKLDKKADDDEYCVDIESESELSPDQLSLGLLEAEEYCREEIKGSEFVTEKCVTLNNAMNDFKDVVINMDKDKLCKDLIDGENFRMKASHILAENEKGRLEYDKGEMECRRKK